MSPWVGVRENGGGQLHRNCHIRQLEVVREEDTAPRGIDLLYYEVPTATELISGLSVKLPRTRPRKVWAWSGAPQAWMYCEGGRREGDPEWKT
jgi:hypothetical protein